MNALPALSLIATEAVRSQFEPSPEPFEPSGPRPAPARSVPSRARAALAAALERAARAAAPAECGPAR